VTDFAPMPGGPDPISLWFAEVMVGAELARPRSQQVAIGPSELGNKCDRALMFKLSGADRVNFPDPLKASVGTGFHELVAGVLRGNPRYLIEHPVTFQGVSGHVDIYDRWYGRVIDLKTTSMSKIKRVKHHGVSDTHRTQIQVYGAGMLEAGYVVKSLALVYIPTDGTLADVYTATLPVDGVHAAEAVQRLASLRNSSLTPDQLPAVVTPLCGWCAFHRPNTPLDSRGCPGGTAEAAAKPLPAPSTAIEGA
jgi:hypothetical protein